MIVVTQAAKKTNTKLIEDTIAISTRLSPLVTVINKVVFINLNG